MTVYFIIISSKFKMSINEMTKNNDKIEVKYFTR